MICAVHPVEFMVVDLSSAASLAQFELNTLAQQGWELVAVAAFKNGDRAYMKRQLLK